MLYTRSIDSDLARVRRTRHSKLEWRSRHMVPSVLNQVKVNFCLKNVIV